MNGHSPISGNRKSLLWHPGQSPYFILSIGNGSPQISQGGHLQPKFHVISLLRTLPCFPSPLGWNPNLPQPITHYIIRAPCLADSIFDSPFLLPSGKGVPYCLPTSPWDTTNFFPSQNLCPRPLCLTHPSSSSSPGHLPSFSLCQVSLTHVGIVSTPNLKQSVPHAAIIFSSASFVSLPCTYHNL